MTTVDLRRIKHAVGDALERDEVLELDETTIGGQRQQFNVDYATASRPHVWAASCVPECM